jgi:hypothetical protein
MSGVEVNAYSIAGAVMVKEPLCVTILVLVIEEGGAEDLVDWLVVMNLRGLLGTKLDRWTNGDMPEGNVSLKAKGFDDAHEEGLPGREDRGEPGSLSLCNRAVPRVVDRVEFFDCEDIEAIHGIEDIIQDQGCV